MPTAGSTAVRDIIEVKSVSVIASRIAEFWMSRLLHGGMTYNPKEHVQYHPLRQALFKMIKRVIKERLQTMITEGTGDQWIINHLAEPYPPFQAALRQSGITDAQWPRHSSMAIVYRDEVFDVRIRRPYQGRMAEKHRQYAIAQKDQPSAAN